VFNREKLADLARKVPPITPEFLESISPKSARNRNPASFLHELYKPGENVLIFTEYRSQGQRVWTHKHPPFNARELDWCRTGERCGVWFLSNPVTGEYSPNDNGQPSRRSWQNVTNWRYLVLESDEADPTHWLGALVQMPLPIAALTMSGGKSIHALIRIDAESKQQWESIVGKWKPALVTLGADAKAMSAVRLTRLANCERLGTDGRDGNYQAFDKPRLQQLLYLNPCPDHTPLAEMPLAPTSCSHVIDARDERRVA
jgi:hypothetical protein